MEKNDTLDLIDWYSLLEKKKDDEDIIKVLDALKALTEGRKLESKTFKDSQGEYEYLFDYKAGFSIGFLNSKLHSVFLYGKLDKKFAEYQHKLPYKLNFGMTNAHIVAKFGEPTQKSGGRTVPITLTYERIGLEITFVSPVWELADNKIGFICIFIPKMTEDNIICAMCRNKSSTFCGGCKLVAYCGRDCQKAHWKFHKEFCG